MPTKAPNRVVVHPIVLLSVVDHFHRLSKTGNEKRVVGILLGSWRKDTVDIATSFAVPFDEDERDPTVWFLDHDYLENMAAMFRKVNSRERIVGWYHTGPKLHWNDIFIHELVGKYCNNPILVIVGAKVQDVGLPTDAYYAVEDVHDDGTPTTKTFEHVASEIGAEESEEVGVEHLLRDIQDKTVGTLSQHITAQLQALQGLATHLEGIRDYLAKVASKELPINHTILYHLQDIFNLLPNLKLEQFTTSFAVKTNDQMLVIYLASLIRSVIALHNLISNKIANREAEKQEGKAGKREGETGKEGGDKKAPQGGDKDKKEGGDKKEGSDKDSIAAKGSAKK
ncbi:hypothetical protein EMCRGX_G031044 [Ephydatia muelleri]